MTDVTTAPAGTQAKVAASLRRRYAAEMRFRTYGIVAIAIGLTFVGFLFYSVIANGYSSFTQTFLAVDVEYSAELIDPEGGRLTETLQEIGRAHV